jgi:hypothetical protein
LLIVEQKNLTRALGMALAGVHSTIKNQQSTIFGYVSV